LYLHKSPHFTAIIDTAAIGVHEIEYFDILPNFYVVERLLVGVDGECFHGGGLGVRG
jgi:hypothetical protein